MVFHDMIADMLNPTVTDLFIRGRELNLILLCGKILH